MYIYHTYGYYIAPVPSGRRVMNFFLWSTGWLSAEGMDSLMAVAPGFTPGGRGMVR